MEQPGDRLCEKVPDSGGELPDVELPLACRNCGIVLQRDRLRRQLYVCDCGQHFRMGADAWIALLASRGTWQEHWEDLRPADHLGWTRPQSYRSIIDSAYARRLNESVRAGTCRIAQHRVWLAVFDFRFVGGTLGVVAGERAARAMEAAAASRMPFVLVATSGGARMQEGTLALMQMAKLNAVAGELQAESVPFLSIVTDPMFGGTAASLALIGDLNIAEPAAAIGFTGARVIDQATHAALPEGFQTAEFQLRKGQIDVVVPRWELRQTIARSLGILTRNRDIRNLGFLRISRSAARA